MIVIIDNGHGEDTAGKRSPDGRLREYAYAREIAKRLQCALCHELGAGHVFLLTKRHQPERTLSEGEQPLQGSRGFKRSVGLNSQQRSGG